MCSLTAKNTDWRKLEGKKCETISQNNFFPNSIFVIHYKRTMTNNKKQQLSVQGTGKAFKLFKSLKVPFEMLLMKQIRNRTK